MKLKLSLSLLLVSTLSGCTASGHLYPVRGPLSTETPTPVYKLKIKDALKSGDISVALDNGETGKSRWKLVPQDKSPNPAPSTNSEATPAALSQVWDTIYGPGFYVAKVLGNRLYAQSTITTNRGTILNVEFYEPDAHANSPEVGAIKGVAKDNKDNLYKLTF